MKDHLVRGALLALALLGVKATVWPSFGSGRGGSTMIGNPACDTRPGHVGHGTALVPSGKNQLAIFAQGCFWGVEERFRKVPGVVATAVGYTGGHPALVTYGELLDFFWQTHDPTSGDRQGPDHGSQYRSAIFTFGPEQMKEALASRAQEQKRLQDTITTEIAPAGPFWMAEDYHQQWDEKHGALSCPTPHRPREESRAGS
jgi:peptide-methionine (S)-S-oxide reductase